MIKQEYNFQKKNVLLFFLTCVWFLQKLWGQTLHNWHPWELLRLWRSCVAVVTEIWHVPPSPCFYKLDTVLCLGILTAVGRLGIGRYPWNKQLYLCIKKNILCQFLIIYVAINKLRKSKSMRHFNQTWKRQHFSKIMLEVHM